jgi:fibrillarin-like rRNA methylase
MLTASMALPVSLSSSTAREAYHTWLERRVLAPMRANEPERYRGMIEQLKVLIAGIAQEKRDG